MVTAILHAIIASSTQYSRTLNLYSISYGVAHRHRYMKAATGNFGQDLLQ